jgi:hypothetical protein
VPAWRTSSSLSLYCPFTRKLPDGAHPQSFGIEPFRPPEIRSIFHRRWPALDSSGGGSAVHGRVLGTILGLRQLDALTRIALFCQVCSRSEMAVNRLVDLDDGAVTRGSVCGRLAVRYQQRLR